MAVWKDGLEQPFVKDRRSLTGADADTSATALHHLPFTGRANHGSLGELARSLAHSAAPSLLPCFPPSRPACHTHMQNKKVMPLRNEAACQRCFSTMRNMQINLGVIYTNNPDMFMLNLQNMLESDL